LRIDRLEAQLRELTGTIEQLQFRNRQLEAQIRSMGGVPGNVQGAVSAPQTAAVPPAQPMQPGSMQPGATQPMRPATAQTAPATPPAPIPGRHADVFDPNQNPNAPGVPRPLGSLPAVEPSVAAPESAVGVPGGRAAGAPLDLSTLAQPGDRRAAVEPGAAPNHGLLPPPPSRNTSATGAVPSVAPPSDSPQDSYDLAYGYVLRKDYALAEDAFHSFLSKYPNDRLAGDATYWLGESMFQRHRFRDAAEAFLNVSTKYESTAKAPDALLRLGQSLAALGEKEAACASLGEVLRKFPRASAAVRQGVEREQKRVRC
jgi:tol-pal system protein YbgF